MAKKTTTTPKRRRATPKSRRPVWMAKFFEVLSEIGNVKQACESAKIDRRTVYKLRATDQEFAEKWEDALDDAADSVETLAFNQAKSNPTMTIFLLKSLRPEKYREFSLSQLASHLNSQSSVPASADRITPVAQGDAQ